LFKLQFYVKITA